MKLKIEVTQEDIDKGQPKNVARCPIAHAAQRAGLKYPEVHKSKILTTLKTGVEWSYALPIQAQIFISHFDYYIPVYPFEFELDVLE